MALTAATAIGPLPRTVIVLGLVSLLMDLSSETIHALLPLFMVNVLGLGTVAIGLLDGGAEALTLALKPWAGRWSDRMGKRKPLTIAGYGLSALAKPLFALAGGVAAIAAARVLDRLGKGIRGAPRDALIADVTAPAQRGAAYGVRQALDTVGALLAPLLAAELLWLFSGDYRAVFWLACLPALAAVALLWLAVREPAVADSAPSNVSATPEQQPIDSIDASRPAVTLTVPRGADLPALPHEADLAALPREFWLTVGFAVLLTLARPGEAFLILRGQSLALGDYLSALLLAAMNLSYALSVWPVGHFFDRIGASKLLGFSLLFLLLSQGTLALAATTWAVFAGALLWGLHLGFSQGVLAALVAHHAPKTRRATAFGYYALAVGLALLGNGAAFGAIWQRLSPGHAFACTSVMAMLTLLALWRWQRRRNNPAPAR
ncbi:MFS transporter [Permianibacter sp. IMCC34836]|uniref:MFS transporter n=1 Tax=Permianibacter fluminis TaxID=2738515 RepID=UPI001556DD9C|nr:MFS transporter [Permianibacter fluminis]NQD36982.1 MFS transporter [Permianibacter fluminis]